MAVKHRIRICIGYNQDGSPILKQLGANSEAELGDMAVRAILASERKGEFIQDAPSKIICLPDAKENAARNGVENVSFFCADAGDIAARLAEEGLEYDEMPRRLFEAYHQAALENHALIADVGQQFYVLSRQENLYADDGFHPNERGSQIAADTIAAVIRQHEEERRPSRASEGVLG